MPRKDQLRWYNINASASQASLGHNKASLLSHASFESIERWKNPDEMDQLVIDVEGTDQAVLQQCFVGTISDLEFDDTCKLSL